MSGRRLRLGAVLGAALLALLAAAAVLDLGPGSGGAGAGGSAVEGSPDAEGLPSGAPPDGAGSGVAGGSGQPLPSPTPTEVGGVLVMWARGGLPPGTATAAAGLPDVEAVAFVRSDTLGLVGSRDADGRTVDRLEEGFRIPVEVAAVDPADYAAAVGDGVHEAAMAALRPGGALLGASAAELRGLGPGAVLDLVGRPGLEVVGIVPDRLVRNAEIVLHHRDAGPAGIGADGSLVVRHAVPAGKARDELTRRLAELAPDDAPARVVDGDRTSAYRAPLVLSLPEVKRRFGEFGFRPRPGVREIDVSPEFVADHIVTAQVPLLGTVRCHAGIVDDLRAALQEIDDAGLGASVDPERYAGCFFPRRISEDRARLSRHAWGIALDINVDLSLPGLGPPPPGEVIEIFGRHGFRWGGDFLHPDNHHFEWVGAAASERPVRP